MQRVDNITTFFTHYFDQKVARVATLPLPRYTKKDSMQSFLHIESLLQYF